MKLKKPAASAVLLVLLSSLIALNLNVDAQQVSLAGDTDKICVIAQSSPDTDAYGNPTVNPDGTFYPNDRFWVKYNVYTASGFNFEGVDVSYDRSAFEALHSSGWGTLSGEALFKVRANAAPGTYTFTVKAAGSATSWGGSGTVTMSYGGVNVAAYYMAECMLTISSGPGGTTNPPPGSYWYAGGTPVSVSALADQNYTLDYWLLDGYNAGSSNPITVMMDAPHTLVAVFRTAGNETAARTLGGPAAIPRLLPLAEVGSRLVIKDFSWTTWFDVLRGTVCRAGGYLYSSDGQIQPYADVVVEFKKRNIWTGAVWISAVTARTNSAGYFIAEETCNPLSEQFQGVVAWAEKAGYFPSWSLTLTLNPSTASVGQGYGFLVGVNVYLNGRYTPVPVALFASGAPQGCTVTFNPAAGNVEGCFRSAMLLEVQQAVPVGEYAITVTASSEGTSDSERFLLEVTEPPRVPSTAAFTAYGLGADAFGDVLVLDGNQHIRADQLPYRVSWETNTAHTYAWSTFVGSTLNGKRYLLENVVATTRYLAVATVKVEVVRYDPHFTLVLAYTVPKAQGNNSYEKQFAMIVRYDGNGPNGNLNQRAVIDGWDWSGYASRIPVQQLVSLTETASLQSVEQLLQAFSAKGGVQFAVAGIDTPTKGAILKVDGEEVAFDQLPKTYNWPVNTVHTYEWAERMPAYVWVEDPRWGVGHYEEASDEWFSFKYTFSIFPESGWTNATQFAEGLFAKVYSPSGLVNATALGNRVIGVYSHNKLLASIAEDAGVHHGALVCTSQNFPAYFDSENRYAKFVFDLDDRVAAEAIRQLFNSSITYEVNFLSSAFTPLVFKTNFTCPLEYNQKQVNVTAVKWDPNGKTWIVDQNLMIEAYFNAAFNMTEAEWFREYLSNAAEDETAFRMALEDIGECLPQCCSGYGSARGILNRTSPYYYNLNITVGRGYCGFEPLPGNMDAWTESVRTYAAVWSSPSCNISADAAVKVAGSASIKVEGAKVANLTAILNLAKPAVPVGELKFSVRPDKECSGDLTVIVYESTGRQQTYALRVQPGVWSEVSVPAAGAVAKVGIYCRLSAPSGAFWVDRLYFPQAVVWKWSTSRTLERTVYINFASAAAYTLYVNMDPLSPLNVTVDRDSVKSCDITLHAPPQLGGLQKLRVYLIVSNGAGEELKPILERNLTAAQVPAEEGWFYEGYAPPYATCHALGFEGNLSLTILKNPEFKAAQGLNSTLLLVEAENVWGTTFRTVVPVQPWGKTFWEIIFEQVAFALACIAVAAIIIALIIRFFRGSPL